MSDLLDLSVSTTTTAAATPSRARPRLLDTSGEFWAHCHPDVVWAITRHNDRIGRRLQLFVERLLLVYLVGPISWLALRVFFRIRLIGCERFGQLGAHTIYAARHFYEWDPFINFYGAIYRHALRRPHLCAVSLAGHYWMKTRVRRAVSWVFGVIGLIRGHGPAQGCIVRAARILEAPTPATVAIYPTGPLRARRTYDVGPGIGYLALCTPDTPVLPITTIGLQEASLRSVLRLERPTLTIAVGTPFCGREIEGATEQERLNAICERVRSEWTRLEREVEAEAA